MTSATTTKAERTRAVLLDAAVELFSTHGYDGTGVRDIEERAGINRGATTYHFGNKDAVWKAAFSHAFSPYLADLRSKKELLAALDSATRARVLVEGFVRTSAERPYMNQLMMHENFARTWRSEWIAEHFLAPARDLMQEIGANDPFLTRLENRSSSALHPAGRLQFGFFAPRRGKPHV